MSDLPAKLRRWCSALTAGALLAGWVAAAPNARAQGKPGAGKSDPSAALAATLTAACRRDEAAFALHLTAQSAFLFRKLPAAQRGNLMGRLAMLNGAGKALLSNTAEGLALVRCDSDGAITELRLSAPETAENLAFVPVEARAGGSSRSVRFGLVREAGDWRLISVGLLLLDLPAMSQEWAEGEVVASEVAAVVALRELAVALETYRRGFDHLPESLEQLGPASRDGVSPDRANLLDAALSAGQKGDYQFRYVIVSAGAGVDESERDKAAGFALAATPVKYGQGGKRSFFLDARGTLRGADKQGAVATSSDPEIAEPRL